MICGKIFAVIKMILMKLLFIFLAYLIGSIPFGYIIGKLKGVDLTKEGSGNVGATNCGRVLGKKYAIIVFALDVLKSATLVFLFRFKILDFRFIVLSPLLYGFLACLGHSFSIFLNFKGGKAVATGCGLILGYAPFLFLLLLLVFLIVKLTTKLVSLGSLICTLIALIGITVFAIIGYDPSLRLLSDLDIVSLNTFPVGITDLICALLAGSLIFIKHAPNIKRLLSRTEKPINY